MRPLMLDLFSGLGGASEAMRARGWEVVRVELDSKFEAEVHADLRTFEWRGRQPDLIWASPPCTEFSRWAMPWFPKRRPDLSLVCAALRIIAQAKPQFWVIENVRGALTWLELVLGKPAQIHGPVCLWGEFPRFEARVSPWKERLSSTQKAERAKIPRQISVGLARACETSLLVG